MKNIEATIASLEHQLNGIDKQLEEYSEIIDASTHNNKDDIEKKVGEALKNSIEKVNDVKNILEMWGTQDDKIQTIDGKTELISKVKNNPMFTKLAKELGKLRKMASSSMNKRFTYGRGQRVGIEYGNKSNEVIPSEFALLANDKTNALFYKKMVIKN